MISDELIEHLNNVDPDSNIFHVNQSVMCEYFTLQKYANYCSENFKFKLINFNIRSFHANINKFEAFLEVCDFKQDFIICTETWNNAETTNLAVIHGYNGFHTCRSGSRGGGVSVYVKNTFVAHKVESLSICTETIETCVVNVSFGRQQLILFGIYRPHSDTIENFSIHLESMLGSSVVSRNALIIIAGDININLGDSSPSVINYVSVLNSMFFLPVITIPTRFPPNNAGGIAPTTLDHIFMNKLVYLCLGWLFLI